MFTFLEKIEIAFENVEVIKIPAKFILTLTMRGVKDFRNSYQNDGKGLAMFRGTSADKIYLQIDKSAKEKFFSNAGVEIFSRIASYQDITSFDLKYNDGSGEKIYTTWDGTDKKIICKKIILMTKAI